MFNAHHIHLDKEYCQREEGYPGKQPKLWYGYCLNHHILQERVVHGPLTAQMLLETTLFHFPGLKLSRFEYRATNPLFVNRELEINGKWLDKNNVAVWCSDTKGVVGMTGKVEIAT